MSGPKNHARAIRDFSVNGVSRQKNSARGLRPLDPEVRIQGSSVRATRNPKSSLRTPDLLRFAERRNLGRSYQEPPRKTRL